MNKSIGAIAMAAAVILTTPVFAQHNHQPAPARDGQAQGHHHGSPGRHLSEDTHALVRRLQAGGLVIFLRHERTEFGKTRDEQTRYDDCASQRNLSASGRESAKNTHEALRLLGIRIGEVRASPLCRTLETAQLAFGKATADEGLLATVGSKARPFDAITGDFKQLIDRLANAPDKSNAALVGHFQSPEALSSVFPEEGEMTIYERSSAGEIKMLGRLTSAKWADVIHDLRRAGALNEKARH